MDLKGLMIGFVSSVGKVGVVIYDELHRTQSCILSVVYRWVKPVKDDYSVDQGCYCTSHLHMSVTNHLSFCYE